MAIKMLCAVVLLAELIAMSLGGTIHLTNSKMSLTGKGKMSWTGSGTIKVSPIENFWAGLTRGRRFPMILNGDLIALKLARSSGTPRWMRCYKSSYCRTSTCPAGPVIMNSKFSSCPREVFRVRVLGKADGQAVESGDFVTITFPRNANKYMYCQISTSTPCYATWSLSPFEWNRKYWFRYSQGVFRIFSSNTDDGKPIQYGDIVGFKYDYQSNKSWLYSDASKIYAKPCSNGHYLKANCAKMNTGFGFQIYKKI